MCPGRDEQNVYITYNVFPKSASYGLKSALLSQLNILKSELFIKL